MIIFLKNKENYDIDQHTKNEYDRLKKLPPKQKETKTFVINGNEYTLHEVLFIGDWCHNQKCNRYMSDGIKAHPLNEECDYDHTYHCEVCDKEMWKRDGDYSKHKWKKVVCYEHSPLGHVPKNEDPPQRTRDMAILNLPEDASDEQIERVNKLLKDSPTNYAHNK